MQRRPRMAKLAKYTEQELKLRHRLQQAAFKARQKREWQARMNAELVQAAELRESEALEQHRLQEQQQQFQLHQLVRLCEELTKSLWLTQQAHRQCLQRVCEVEHELAKDEKEHADALEAAKEDAERERLALGQRCYMLERGLATAHAHMKYMTDMGDARQHIRMDPNLTVAEKEYEFRCLRRREMGLGPPKL